MIFPEDLKLKLRAYITGRSGLYFKDYDLKDLEKAVSKRMAEISIDSPLTYYNLITTALDRETEFRELLNLLTINHTYFFRNEPQFVALKEKVLPEIIQKKMTEVRDPGVKPSVRIWSAGCSSGEEPYSIAITLKELIPDIENWDIEILATDVSTNILEKARAGIFGRTSTKSVSKERLEKYFTEKKTRSGDKQYAVNDEIKRLVRFDYHNMIEDPFSAGLDIIFCRNVVIYFELATTIATVNRFYNSLNDGGYIFMGYSETLQYISDKFRMQDFGDAIYYRKLSPGEIKEETPRSTFDLQAQLVMDKVSKAQIEAEEKEFVTPETLHKKIRPLVEKAKQHIFLKQYQSAVPLVEEAIKTDKEAVEPYYLAAEIYANQGYFSEAKKYIADTIKADRLFAPAHYLAGTLYSEEGDTEQAKKSFKKALFLDKDFLLSSLSLANVYKTEGRPKDAIRQYRNTLKLLSKYKSDDIIAYSGGFSTTAISSVCKDNIERLKYSL